MTKDQSPPDLVERIRKFDRWDGHTYKHGFGTARGSDLPFQAATHITHLEAEVEALRKALEPSCDTKAAYMGEFSFTIMQVQEDEDGEPIECPVKTYVPWTTVKEIMAAISAEAKALLERREP